MKKYVFLAILLITISSFSQKKEVKQFTDNFIKECIIEIYQSKSDELVFNSSSNKAFLLTDFMKNRVVVEYQPSYKGKGFISTNDLSVFNKYNSSLKNDSFYDKDTFNPLKYLNSINLNATSKEIYRIAETDFIMIVSPSF